MANYVLEITLLSPLTSASGEGRVGITDRDVVFDDLGLPILPGKRLKGLWRKPIATLLKHGAQILSTQPEDRAAWAEDHRDVVKKSESDDEAPIPVKYIFGKSGKRPDKGGARLYIANAELQNAASLKEWLKYLQHPRGSSSWELNPDDVVQHFATVRAQTAMDRQTGAAREDTLRLTRTLQPGLVFHAPVSFLGTPNDELFNALALGAAALKYMGVSRTRGLGRVRCRLLSNLTEQVLNRASFPKITVAGPASSVQISTEQTGPSEIESGHDNNDLSEHPSTADTQHLLRYRLTLKDSIVMSVVDSDPNTVGTQQYISGSHIWGAAAWYYLQQSKHGPTDSAFQHAFLDGKLRFLAAYPEACDNEPGQRLLPIPHALRQFKEDEQLVDILKKTPVDLRNQPIKRINRQYAKISQYKLETQVVKTERNYHHARAKDRRKGRALENDGTVFKYEAIQASQTFQGAVLGSEDDLRKLKEKWLEGLDGIKIGRSRSAQYGGATFEWMDDVPQKLNELSSEWDGFAKSEHTESHKVPALDRHLLITTLSPFTECQSARTSRCAISKV